MVLAARTEGRMRSNRAFTLIELLVVCLTTTRRKNVFELPVDDLGNLDDDMVENFNRSYIETGQALERIDPERREREWWWG